MAHGAEMLDRRLGSDSRHAPVSPGATCARDFRAMWDEGSDWWAPHLKEDKNRRLQVFPLVLEMLGELKHRRLLDAGCGEGTFARLLADAGSTVTGIDFSRLLDFAVEEEALRPRGIHYLKADLTDLRESVPRGFDAAVCNLVLHCLPELDPVLQSLRAQLRPGGVLVVSDLHPETFPHYSRAWTVCARVGGNEYRYQLGADSPALRLFLHSMDELESAFDRNGLVCRERQAPSAPSCAQMDAALPQFVYYRLQDKGGFPELT